MLKSKQLNTLFLRCKFPATERQNLHDDRYLIVLSFLSFDENPRLNNQLYGSDEFNNKINREIVLCTTYYIKSTKRFEKRLFNKC